MLPKNCKNRWPSGLGEWVGKWGYLNLRQLCLQCWARWAVSHAEAQQPYLLWWAGLVMRLLRHSSFVWISGAFRWLKSEVWEIGRWGELQHPCGNKCRWASKCLKFYHMIVGGAVTVLTLDPWTSPFVHSHCNFKQLLNKCSKVEDHLHKTKLNFCILSFLRFVYMCGTSNSQRGGQWTMVRRMQHSV